jgi:AcrR family transcriptional regulator
MSTSSYIEMKKISPEARTPQRLRGRQRVAALLKAAAAVFAETGYAAATMSEIAARAKAPIGSLYQFFPNKELLGDALMRNYLELATERLDAVTQRLPLPFDEFAGELLSVFLNLQSERLAALSIFEAMPRDRQPHAAPFREAMLDHIARMLQRQSAHLPAARAKSLAPLLLQQMKTAVALREHAGDAKAAARLHDEHALMLALYLEKRLRTN